MSRLAGISLLFAAGIAAHMALEQWTESLGWPRWPTVVRNTLSLSQVTTLAILAALMPGRRMVAALLVVLFFSVHFLAELVAGTKHSFSAWSSVDLVATELAFVLTVFLVVQGCRVFAGWRIAADGEAPTRARGQFQLSELIEWTATWCLVLGANQISGTWASDSAHAKSWAILVLQQLLYGLPVAYLMLAPRLNWASFALSIFWLCCATPIWMFAQASYVPLAVILSLWKQGIFAGVVFWALLTVHFLLIRSLGYRWYRPTII